MNKVPVVAIIGITLIEIIALLKGVNGTLLMISFTIIGGIAGYEIKEIKDKILNIRLKN